MRITTKKGSLKKVTHNKSKHGGKKEKSSRKKHSSIKKTTKTKKAKKANNTKNTKNTKNPKNPKRTKRRNTKKTNKTKKNRRGAGGDEDEDLYPVYSDAQIENMTTKEMFNSLNEGSDDRKDFLKTYKNEPDNKQRLALEVMLAAQNRSNAAMAEYVKETEKYMVHEPGKMPYDSRLTQDTQVDAPKTGFQVIEPKKPIANFDPNSEYKTERLKAAFRNKWFRENMDINHALRTIESSNARHKPPSVGTISVSYVHRMHEKYYKDFHDFINTDPEYLEAAQEESGAFKRMGEMLEADNDSKEWNAPLQAPGREKRKREEREERRRNDEEAARKRKDEEAAKLAKIKQDRKDGKFDPEEEIYYSDVLRNGYYIGTSRKTGKKYTMLPSGKTVYLTMDVDPRLEHEVTTPNAHTVIPDYYQSIQYSDEALNKHFAPPPPPAPTAKSSKEKRRELLRKRQKSLKEGNKGDEK